MDSKTTNIELKKISETEYLVGRNLTQLIHGNIIYVNAVGEQTAELAELQNKINMTLATASNGKINYLIDLNKCGKNSPEARQTWNDLCMNANTLKVAVFGLHPVAKVLASFVMGITNRKNERFFTSEEDALKWLLEDNTTQQ